MNYRNNEKLSPFIALMENNTNSVHISSEKDRGGNSLRSMLMMAISMLILGSIGVFRRYIPLSSSLLSFFRGAIGSLFLLIFLRASGRKVSRSLPRRILVLLIVSGAMIGVNWILMFEAYNYTTIPTATLCYYMEPTIVVLLSPVFFKEKLTLKKLVCAAAALIGMVLVSGAADEGLPHGDTLLGILFSLAAAVLYSGVVILNKMIRNIDPYVKTIFQLSAEYNQKVLAGEIAVT